MTYSPQTWINGPGGGTPLDATRLTSIETGIYNNSTGLDTANQNIQLLNVKSSGAVGDGTTDDTTAIQNCITAAGTSYKVYFPPGTYKVSSTLNLLTGTKLLGAGADVVTIDGSSIVNTTHAVPTMEATGTFTSTTSNLSANVTPNSLTATVVSATGFAAGDYVRIESTTSTGTDGILAGEILRIYSIATNTLTFDSFVQGNYTTAATGKITKVTLMDGVSVEGINFLGTANDTTAQNIGISFQWCINPRVRRCRFTHCHEFGVWIYNSLSARVIESEFFHCADATWGYAVVNDGATADSVVANNTFRNCKAAIEHTGSTSSGGVPRRCIFVNNTITGAYRGAMQSHTGAEDLIFAHNTVASTTSNELSGAQVDGMNVWGTRQIIMGNTFSGIFRRAIYSGNGTTGNPYYTVIIGNTVNGASLGVGFGRAIEIDLGVASGGTVEGLIIEANTIKMAPAGNTDPAIDIENTSVTQVPGVKIMNNLIYADTTNQAIRAVYLKDFTISGNTVNTFGTGAAGIQVDNSTGGAICNNVCNGSGGSNTSAGITGTTTIQVACIGNFVRNFQTGIKTNTGCDRWTVSGNVLNSFVNTGAATSLTGANNQTTGANIIA